MQFYIKRTVLVYFYLLTIQVACFPGMLNEKDDIAKKLQCWISNNVDELLQIEKLNSEEFGLFRTQLGHAIIFEDFKQYSLGSNVMTFINKKVSLKYIMNLRFQQSVNIDHSLQEGLNFVYIKTKLNFQKDGINLHIFNIYQQGQLKQIIQETNNGIVYSFSFHEQQDYYVQIIFATLIQNKFNANYADIVPFIKSLQKDYQVCSILECKQDIYLPQILNQTNINQLEPKNIKQAYFRTSQSIQYYDMINSIYFGQINVEDDKILNRAEFSVDCIQLMQNSQERDGITVDWNQYFCINNLVYHFKIKKIQNQNHSKNYFLLFQVNHDINTQELLLQLFNLLDNLKCLQGDHITHNLLKLKEKNSSFIQQFQTSEKLMEEQNLELQVEMKTEDQKMEVVINNFQEETIYLQKEEIISPQNKQSTLLTEQDSHSETIDFIEMPQFYGQISLVQQNIQEQLSEDDIFSQPLQVEEALHQKRLNQIEQEEKKTQEVQEAITFEQNQQQQQKQQNEDIVFDEYNQDQLQRNKQAIQPEINNKENQVENQRQKQNNLSQESHHQHHHHHQKQQDETSYDSYESHRNHHIHNHHHHHHQNHHNHHEQEFSENDYSNYEYDNPIDVDYLEYQHEHHHHRKHHHKYYQQEDQNILSNQSRYNLRGSQQNRYQDQQEEPQVVDKMVIEFNFQQREVQKENDQAKQPKEKDDSNSQKERTQKVENQQKNQKNELKNFDQDKSKRNNTNISNQQGQQLENLSSKDKNKQQDKLKVEDKQKSEEKENDRNSDSEQIKKDEEIEDEDAQKNKEQQENDKNKQKQKTQKEKAAEKNEEEQEENKDKEREKDIDKENDKVKEKEQENQEKEEEDKPSNQNKNKEQNNKNKNKDQEDSQNEEKQENQDEENKQEDQENQENEESKQEEVEKQDDQEENEDKPKQKDKDKSDKDKAKQKKKEDCKKNKKQKEEVEEEEKEVQQDEDKQQEDEQQEEKNEDIEVEEQAEEIYDDYGRYKPNDPFYEHRHSKRGRVPFNYPTRDPYQDMFEDEMFWRYNTMKRQQARFPFNGYPYRHRGRSIDHSPFPHVNSYYKQHPFQKQTYNAKPLFGRDFYPEAGYGMSRVIDAYKGRYTDPEQVLREISVRHQQEKMWRDSLRQYREEVGYSRGPSEYFDDYVPWQYEVPQGSRETFQTGDQFQPFEFNKEIQEETYDYLKDPQYKFRQGKRELVKNFPKPNNKANYDSYDSYEPRDCFVIYDECNFQGNRLDLCGEYPDIPQYLNNFKVFSFIVPVNLKIKLFQSTQFQDDLQDVEGTQECLEIPYELVPAQ